MPLIELPKPLSLAPFAVTPGQPTYTDIYNDTVGKLALEQESIDPALSAMADISAALDAEQIADVGGNDIGLASDAADGFSTTALDGHVSGFVASQPDSQTHVDAVGNSNPDILRELPMDATFDGGIGAAPTETTINLPAMKVGDAPQIVPLGTTTLTVGTQTYSGLQSAFFADGDLEFFDIAEADWQNGTDSLEKSFFTLVCTPTKVGKFFVEIDVIQDTEPRKTILTVNMTVTA